MNLMKKKSFVFSGVMKVVRGWDGWTCRGLKTNQSFCDKSRDKEKLPERFKIKTFSVVLHRVSWITFFSLSFLLSDFMRELFRVQRAFILIPPVFVPEATSKQELATGGSKPFLMSSQIYAFFLFNYVCDVKSQRGFSFFLFSLYTWREAFVIFSFLEKCEFRLAFLFFSSLQMAWNDAIHSHRAMNDDGFL